MLEDLKEGISLGTPRRVPRRGSAGTRSLPEMVTRRGEVSLREARGASARKDALEQEVFAGSRVSI